MNREDSHDEKKRNDALFDIYLGPDARRSLREHTARIKEHELNGEWTHGVSIGTGQMTMLLDYIDELEEKIFHMELEAKLTKE